MNVVYIVYVISAYVVGAYTAALPTSEAASLLQEKPAEKRSIRDADDERFNPNTNKMADTNTGLTKRIWKDFEERGFGRWNSLNDPNMINWAKSSAKRGLDKKFGKVEDRFGIPNNDFQKWQFDKRFGDKSTTGFGGNDGELQKWSIIDDKRGFGRVEPHFGQAIDFTLENGQKWKTQKDKRSFGRNDEVEFGASSPNQLQKWLVEKKRFGKVNTQFGHGGIELQKWRKRGFGNVDSSYLGDGKDHLSRDNMQKWVGDKRWLRSS